MDPSEIDTEGLYSQARESWRKFYSGVAEEKIGLGGLLTGAGFQCIENYSREIEEIPGTKIEDNFFREVLNPYKPDKFVHFYFFYGVSRTVLTGMDSLPRDFSYAEKTATTMVATGAAGIAIEETDPYYDPFDLAANFLGASLALEHHRRELESDQV